MSYASAASGELPGGALMGFQRGPVGGVARRTVLRVAGAPTLMGDAQAQPAREPLPHRLAMISPAY